jgi:protein disulfide-isomerase A6
MDGAPTVVQSEPWDGKDGVLIEEDEFSLEDLMGDDSPPKDEL